MSDTDLILCDLKTELNAEELRNIKSEFNCIFCYNIAGLISVLA